MCRTRMTFALANGYERGSVQAAKLGQIVPVKTTDAAELQWPEEAVAVSPEGPFASHLLTSLFQFPSHNHQADPSSSVWKHFPRFHIVSPGFPLFRYGLSGFPAQAWFNLPVAVWISGRASDFDGDGCEALNMLWCFAFAARVRSLTFHYCCIRSICRKYWQILLSRTVWRTRIETTMAWRTEWTGGLGHGWNGWALELPLTLRVQKVPKSSH